MFKRKSDTDLSCAEKSQKAGEDRRVTFVTHLRALNTQFAAWVAEQASEHVTELWSDGVEDYVMHAKKLLADFKDVLQEGDNGAKASGGGGAGEAKPAAAAPPAAGLSFGALPGSSKPPLAGNSLVPSFLSGGSGQPAFTALPSTGAAFNFGVAPAAAGMFKVPSVPSTGTLGTVVSATTAEEEDGDEEEQQAQEPSVQLEPSNAEILLKKRARLMSMVEEAGRKKWKDKGAGTLSLRRALGEEAAGKQPYLVFTTDSGRVLINAPLVKGMKPTSNPRTPANLAMFLVSCVDGEEHHGMHLFKCADSGAAKELNEKILQFV